MEPQAFYDRFAVSTVLYSKLPLDEALRRIAGAGFRWVEFAANRYHLDPRLDVDLAALRRALDELGLRAHSIHAPFSRLNLGHPDGDAAEWRRVLGGTVRLAGEIGAGVVVLHSSTHPAPLPESRVADSRRVGRELVADLVDLAEPLGVRLALENMLSFGFWQLGRTLRELAAENPDPRVGFCLDIGHASLNGADLADEVAAAGDRLISIHAHNNDGHADRHWVPTEGVIDYPGFLKVLGAAGYTRRIVLETQPGDDADRTLARLSGLWRELP